jgi:hypothetical protein
VSGLPSPVTTARREAVLAALEQGPKTTQELCAAAGVADDKRGCDLVGHDVRRLRDRGHLIENERDPGSTHGGLYWLAYDHAERRCEFVGCDTVLRRDNRSRYCSVHGGVYIGEGIVDVLIAALERDQRLQATVSP